MENFAFLLDDPIVSLGFLSFVILLINLPLSFIAYIKNQNSLLVQSLTILVNIILALQLIIRWYSSGHFPVSNLYESLCFLAWAITIGQLWAEKEYKSPIIASLLTPISLFSLAFASFVLPNDLIVNSYIVPALRSSWLVMHVTVVMLSYAALLIGSIFSASLLFIDKDQPLQIRSNSIGVGGYRSPNKVIDKLSPIEFSRSELLDTLSYRVIVVGFVLLTLGLISGSVWANEAWGTWWSWDPKETWAFICWLFYAAYLHMRISKGWQGRKPALLASIGFVMVLFCYLGVNYFGVGLHSYGWFFNIIFN